MNRWINDWLALETRKDKYWNFLETSNHLIIESQILYKERYFPLETQSATVWTFAIIYG